MGGMSKVSAGGGGTYPILPIRENPEGWEAIPFQWRGMGTYLRRSDFDHLNLFQS